MNPKVLISKSPFWVTFTSLILIAMLLLLALPSASVSAAPLALPAVDGDGAMTVSPTSAAYGSTGNTFTFTFSPTGGRDFVTGSSVNLTIPAGWPAPVMLTNVFVNQGTCSLNPSWTIVDSTIKIDVWSCLSGQSFTITYSGVTVPGFSGSPYTFLTETDVPGGNGTFPIASSPAITITPALLTVSAAGLTPANKVYDGDTTTTLTIGSPTLVGVIGAEEVSLVTTGATGAFVDENVGTAKTVNISGLTIDGADAGNYTLIQPTRTANITAKPITITADAGQTKVFGATDPIFAYTASEPLILGDSFSGALNRAAGESVGSYSIGQGTLTAGTNYAITFVTSNFTITAKPITVTADAGQTKVFGSADPAAFTYASSDLGASFTGALNRAAGENVGTYAIGQGTLSAGANYAITFVGNNFTITAKPITVTADAGQTKVYGTVDPALTYVSSDLAAVFTGALGRAAGENVGAYTINQGTLSAGTNYTISFTGSNFAITPASLTATANNKLIVYGSVDPVFDITYTGFQFTDDASVLDVVPTCGVSGPHAVVGTYPIVCSGGSDSNYIITHVDGTLTVSLPASPIFADVPLNYWAISFIERLYGSGITGGCSTIPLNYCPGASVTRAQMAIFLLRGIHGASYTPPAVGAGTGFTDVPVDHPAAAWIKQLAAEGITGGCGVGIYCPDAVVTRAQMAIFLLRAKYTSSYTPPPATGVFVDVPISHPAAAWIEQLAAEGITGGCGVDTYCPDNNVTRDQMAIFLVRTFSLP